jgi:hypothetical protein
MRRVTEGISGGLLDIGAVFLHQFVQEFLKVQQRSLVEAARVHP